MLSCFGGHRSRHGKGHKHRAKHAAYSEANTSSTASELSAAAAVAAVHHSGGLQNGGMQNGGGGPASGHARSASAASVPQPTTPRQAQRRLSPVGGNPHPGENVAARQECGLTVAVPSFDSETSSMEAAWVAGYDGRHNTCGGGAGNGVGSMSMSSASFTSARSSFSSTVSSAQSDGDFSFRPHLNCHTGGGASAAPSTRGGSEDGSVHGPSTQGGSFSDEQSTRRGSWMVEASTRRGSWMEDPPVEEPQQEAQEAGSSRRASWSPHDAEQPGPPPLPGLAHSTSWEGGRDGTDDESDSESVESAAAVRHLLRQAEAAHAEGQLLRCREMLRQAAGRHGCTFAELLADGAQAALGITAATSLDLQQLGRELELIRHSLGDAQDLAGYITSSDDDLKVMYRYVKGSGIHSFRFEATYDCPVSHMLAITREFDLLGTWNRLALDPAILAEPSEFTTINYVGQWMPFPLSELDLVVRTQWSDLLEEEQALLITLSDFSDGVPAPGIAHLPRKSSKRRRIQLLAGSSSILQPYPCTADGRQRCRCAMLAHLDPHISRVPSFVISFVLKVLSPFIYNATKELLATNFHSPELELPRRMAANPKMYKKVEERFRSPPHGTPPPPPVGRSLATSFRHL